MGKRVLLLVSVLLLLAAVRPPSAAGHGGWQTYIVSAHDADTENGTVAWFTVENSTEPNPSLPVHANETVIVHFVNLGERNHTLVLGPPIDERVGPVGPGEEASLSFRVPADASGPIAYRDPDWADRGMEGQLEVEGASTPQATSALSSAGMLATLAGLAAAVRLVARDP